MAKMLKGCHYVLSTTALTSPRDWYSQLSRRGTLMKTSQIDVLVIGAGPSGLMAATALAKAGVSVRIIDKRPARVLVGQADGAQPRTLELLHTYGLLDRLRRHGYGNNLIVQSTYGYSPDTQGLVFNQRVPVTFPAGRFHAISSSQGTFEENFIHFLDSEGIHVERLLRPTQLEIAPDSSSTAVDYRNSYPVSVTLVNSDSAHWQVTEQVAAKYVIGADGARSWVRESLEIPMIGNDTEDVWGVLDFTPKSDFPDLRHVSVIKGARTTCLIIPRERGLIRLYVQLGVVEEMKDREPHTWQDILAIGQAALKPYYIESVDVPEWWSVYRVRQQVAARFDAQQRVFIVGDACHTHSPNAGQGMNAGINDSHNLVWKLAHVLRGWANPSLLQTYGEERRAFAFKLIKLDQVIATSMAQKVKNGPEDDDGIDPNQLADLYLKFSSFISGIGIRYEPSILTQADNQALAGGLLIGTRLPPAQLVQAASGHEANLQDLVPSNTLYKVIVFAGNVSDPTQQERLREGLIGIHGVHKYLQRPRLQTPMHVEVLIIAYGMEITYMSNMLEGLVGMDWTRVYSDTPDAFTPANGDVHATFKVNPAGVVVTVRPDGYIGALTALGEQSEEDLRKYFDRIYSLRTAV